MAALQHEPDLPQLLTGSETMLSSYGRSPWKADVTGTLAALIVLIIIRPPLVTAVVAMVGVIVMLGLIHAWSWWRQHEQTRAEPVDFHS